MSHIAKIDIEIKSVAALKKACQRLGLTFVENKKTYAWYGRWVGDSPFPQGFLPEEEQKVMDSPAVSTDTKREIVRKYAGRCDHAIRLPNQSYEMGVVKRGGRYHILWDTWQQDTSLVGGEKAPLLSQMYGVEAAKLAAYAQGYACNEQLLDDGTIQLTINT